MRTKDKKKGYYYAQTQIIDQSQQEVAVQHEVESIIAHRFKNQNNPNHILDEDSSNRKLLDVPNNQLMFLVRWKGCVSVTDVQSWEPGENLKNAPDIVEQYKSKFYKQMQSNRSQSTGKKRGRKPKGGEVGIELQQKSEKHTRGFKFDKIYNQDHKGIKKAQEDQDELCIIDEAAFFQATSRQKGKKGTIKLTENNLGKSFYSETPLPSKDDRKFKPCEKGLVPIIPVSRPQPLETQKENINSALKHFMPQNYGQLEAEPQIFQEPSQSLSNFLDESQYEKRENKRSIQAQKSQIQQKNLHINQPISENIMHEQPLAIDRLKDKNQLFLACINSLDSSQERRQNNSIPMFSQSLCLEDYILGNYSKERSQKPFNEERKTKKIDDHKSNNDKRSKAFQYAPEETGEKIVKKIKKDNENQLNIPFSCDQNQMQFPPQARENSKEKTGSIVNKKVDYDLLFENEKVFSKPVQIEMKNPIKNLLQKKNLNQRIDHEIRSLYQTQSISVLEEERQPLNKNIINQPSSKKVASKCSSFKDNCKECQQMTASYDLLVDYIKFHLSEMNQQNCVACLEKIYEDQQTYILVNGLNPNQCMQKSDKIRKISNLENNKFLQSTIERNIAKQSQLNEIVCNYKLGKIAFSKKEWYGVFRIQKLNPSMSHYRYVRIKDLAKSHKQRISSYFSERK